MSKNTSNGGLPAALLAAALVGCGGDGETTVEVIEDQGDLCVTQLIAHGQDEIEATAPFGQHIVNIGDHEMCI